LRHIRCGSSLRGHSTRILLGTANGMRIFSLYRIY
jgi:hypothetical protein